MDRQADSYCRKKCLKMLFNIADALLFGTSGLRLLKLQGGIRCS